MVHYEFQQSVRDVLHSAKMTACELGHETLTPDHILLALLASDAPSVAPILDGSLASRADATEAWRRSLIPGGGSSSRREVPYSPSAKRVLEHAMISARSLGHEWIATSHLLGGLMKLEDSKAATFLREHGLEADQVEAAVAVHSADETSA